MIGLQTYEVTVPVDTDYVYLYIAHYATNPQVEISVNGGSSWTSYSPAPFPPTSPAQPYAINAYLSSVVSDGDSFLVRGLDYETAIIGICVDDV